MLQDGAVVPSHNQPSRSPWLRLWDFLTEPCPRVLSADHQLEARLLASLLLLLILLGLMFAALFYWLAARGPLWESFVFRLASIGIGTLCISYGLSRTRYFRIGGALAIGVTIMVLIGAALFDTSLLPGLLYFFLIPIVLASLLFPVRWAAGTMLLCLSLIAVSPIVVEPGRLVHTLVGPFNLTLIICTMILILINYHRRLEHLRRAALAASEERYRKLVEHSPEMIAVHREGIFEYINSAGAAMLGAAEPDELIGRSLFELVHPDDCAIVENRIYHRGADLQHTEARLRRKDGSYVYTEGTGILVEYRGHQAIQIIVRDVTERKQVEQDMRWLRSGIEQSEEAIFMTDTGGRIVYANPAFEAIYGYTRDEAIGKTPRILKSGLLSDEVYASFWSILLGKETVSWQITNRRKDGSLIEVDSTASPVVDEQDNIIGFLAIQHDITARKQAEEDLKQYASRLELLHGIDHAILTAERPDEIAAAALAHLHMIVPFIQGSVTEFHFKDGHAEILAALGDDETGPGASARVPIEIFPELSRMREGKHVLLPDLSARSDLNEYQLQLLRHGVRAVVNMPLISRRELIGSVNLGVADARMLEPRVLEILHEIGDQIAIAIQDTRLRDALRRHSDHLEALVAERTREVLHVKERVETILDNSPDSIMLIRQDGTIETANQAFLTTFGYHPDESYLQPLTLLAAPANHAALQRALETARSGESTRLEIKARRKNGTMFDADLALAPVREGSRIASLVCSLRDISKLKEIERMKDAFVSNVSHELRTPITSLKLFHQLLVKMPARQDEYLESLQREVVRLERIIDDLLTLSRLDQKHIPLHSGLVDLNQLIEDYITDREPMAESRGLHLSFNPAASLPPAYGDRNLMGQVLSILLTNALNYTPAEGSVYVMTHTPSEDTGKLIGFSVCDTGPGILPDERSQVFDRFFRGSASRAANSPGTGLGLAIAREIVELHGGHIEVDGPARLHSGYQGACFTVWLPMTGEPQRTAVSGWREDSSHQIAG